MERLIFFSPFIIFLIGFNLGINASRGAAALSAVAAFLLYPSLFAAFSTVTAAAAAEFFLELFYKKYNSAKTDFTKKIGDASALLSAAKSESEIIKKTLSKSEKAIKNILHVYELSKDIASYTDLEKMFNLIVLSLDEQFGIKDVAMRIFEYKKIFQKGSAANIDENIKILAIAGGIVQVPLNIGEKKLGILSAMIPKPLENDSGFVDEISAFAEEITVAIQRAVLHLKVEEMSRTDGLTGLYRRGYLNERLKEEEFRARRWHGKFSLLMMDIDHFKHVNDTYGHQAGDTVLKTVADILKNSVYETDFAARYGGEEFVVIFPQTDPARLKIKAEKIRQQIEAAEIIVGFEKLKVTSSFGIAHFPKDGLDAEDVLRKADKSLYKSKETGRNKVTEWEG